jgi:hypothetical protein
VRKNIHACECVCVCVHAYEDTCIRASACEWIYKYIHVCVCVLMYVRVRDLVSETVCSLEPA